jgi:SAM-dependent methyltransferase
VAGTALNYEYVLQRALSATAVAKPRILDYGSGQGQLIALARSRNVDIYGVDVPGIEVTDRASLIDKDGRISHPDNSFDVVVSNQVFEHVATPPVALAEIHRVLKPGGVFLALFPDDTVWFEGHIGLYFVHWMRGYPGLLRAYLKACYALGLGYYRDGKSATEWADWAPATMRDEVCYHSAQDVRRWWREAFGVPAESWAHDYMCFRIAASPRLKPLLPLASKKWMGPILGFICRVRAGLVLRTRKRG